MKQNKLQVSQKHMTTIVGHLHCHPGLFVKRNASGEIELRCFARMHGGSSPLVATFCIANDKKKGGRKP
jgi:metallophosphoesterase superfamily enzyme